MLTSLLLLSLIICLCAGTVFVFGYIRRDLTGQHEGVCVMRCASRMGKYQITQFTLIYKWLYQVDMEDNADMWYDDIYILNWALSEIKSSLYIYIYMYMVFEPWPIVLSVWMWAFTFGTFIFIGVIREAHTIRRERE